MKKVFMITALTAVMLMASLSICWAHFGMIIPSDDIVGKEDKKTITLDIGTGRPTKTGELVATQ